MALIEKSDDVLKLAVAAGILSAGIGVGYYYGLHLPGRDERVQLEETERRREARASEEQAQERRQESYRSCMVSAEADYSSRWDASCKRNAERAAQNRKDCMTRGLQEDVCTGLYPPVPAANCSLPNELADDYDAARESAKKQCLEEAKSGVAI